MLSNSVRKRGLIITAIVAVVVALEVWALAVPMLKQATMDFLGGMDARTVAVRLDLILFLPILLSLVTWAWSGRAAPRMADVLTLSTAWSLTKRYGLLLIVAGVWLLSSGGSGRFVLALVVLAEAAFFVILVIKSAALRRQLIESRRSGYSLTTSVLVAANRLRLSRGLRLETVFDIRDLVSVVQADAESAEAADVRFGEKPQLIIELCNPVDVYGWFGVLEKARLIAVQVDDPKGLQAALR